MTTARRFWVPFALVVVLLALALDLWKPSEPIGIDFHTYEAAARVGLQEGWSQIYAQTLVAFQQTNLVPGQTVQPFLSPPPVAWLAALLAPLPYWPSYYVWAFLTFMALTLALVWASTDRGLVRWVAAGAALTPWWVMHAVHLGQVVPLVAAGVVLSWRLARERRDLAAGIALALVLLKPNTAVLVPFALLAVGRFRLFAVWVVASFIVAVIALVTLGSLGVSAYLGELTAPLPAGANSLTVEGALGVGGAAAVGMRVIIVAASLATAFRLRRSPGLAIAAGALGSLLIAPYLHGSDLCLLGVAAWIVWEERTAVTWRIPIAAGWVVASPFVASSPLSLGLNRWPLVELLLLVALVVEAWRPGREREPALTGNADLRSRAPA